MTLHRIALTLLLTLIIGGHIAMWTSDMPKDLALKLTLINAAGWAVVLIPAIGVAMWAKARRSKPAPEEPKPIRSSRNSKPLD
jgi:preprotein translocase subunit SecF